MAYTAYTEDSQTIVQLKRRFRQLSTNREHLEAIWIDFNETHFIPAAYPPLIDDKILREAMVLQEEGKRYFAQGEYRKSLLKYNEALCKAPNDSTLFPLLYECRSEVYLTAGCLPQCLENLNLALESNSSTEKANELKEKREYCLKRINKMADQETNVKPKPKLSPNLSHSPNPKIPFLSNAVNIKIDPQFGPRLLAVENLKPSDIFMTEPIFLKGIDPNSKSAEIYGSCSFCLQPHFLSLFPCPGCTSTVFCKECLQEFQKLHQFECPVVTFALYEYKTSLITRSLLRILSLYDYDFNQLKKDIQDVQLNPQKLLEGDYVKNSERQIIRWLFPRWRQVSFDEIVEKGLISAKQLYLSMQSKPFRALINTSDKEITVLEVTFNLLLQTEFHQPENGVTFWQPVRSCFSTEDSFNLSATCHSYGGVDFAYCLRPVRCGETIKIINSVTFLEDFPWESFDCDIVRQAKYGNPGPLIGRLWDLMPESFRKRSGIELPGFDVSTEVMRICKGQESFVESRKRYIRILSNFDSLFPSFEMAMVMWSLKAVGRYLYNDKIFLAATLMSKEAKF